jgi:triosephosphate isomerase
VIIGHSERRQFFSDTDETVNLKIKAAVRNGLIPILCIGESLAEREDGRTFDVVGKQLAGGCKDFTPNSSEFVIAYEPVWAIGTGKTASPEQAQEVHAFIRNELKAHYGSETAEAIRILYGGSVKPENSNALMSKPDIDGGLIGGASLKVSDFVGIIREGT